jgi:hypothetical protein
MTANAKKLSSMFVDWEKMQPTPTSNGMRRAVFEGPTATLDKLHCHITTLNPGEVSGPPRLHLQEEVIIVKKGAWKRPLMATAKSADRVRSSSLPPAPLPLCAMPARAQPPTSSSITTHR